MMKTLSPFVHGLSNGASLTTDISGTRFNAPYVKAVSARYSQEEKQTEDYLRGQKIGMAASVILALLAMAAIALLIFLWHAEVAAIIVVILWQLCSMGNAFYAIRYEREFIKGNV